MAEHDQKDEANGENAAKRMCRLLHKYYKKMGRGDEYITKAGIGKFEAWCNENGYNDAESGDDELEDELKGEADNCLLVDFDDNFPLPPDKQTADEDKKKAEIFKILKLCYEDHDFDLDVPMFDQNDFDNISSDDIDEVKKIYQTYCPTIFNMEMSRDGSLLHMLAFQHKQKVHYLANLVDSFARYRVMVDPTIGAAHWAMLPDNSHFQKGALKNVKLLLSVQQTKYADFAANCIKSFHHRCCNQLMFRPQCVINDSLEAIANYISAAVQWIRNFLEKINQNLCPFQIDLGIALGEPIKVDMSKYDVEVKEKKATQQSDNNQSQKPPAQSEQDEIDDDGDDSDQDEHIKAMPTADDLDDEKDGRYIFDDYVQDIVAKLDANKLPYFKLKLGDEKEGSIARKLHVLFRKFTLKNNIHELDDNMVHYLHHKRLILMVDRRQSAGADTNKDEIFMYEPPNDAYTRNIPRGDALVPEWFISASRTSMLPNIGYDAEDATGNTEAKRKESEKKQGQESVKQEVSNTMQDQTDANIGVGHHAKRGLLTLSFHVFGEDHMKLYLFWQGQMIRFLPSDIRAVLPQFFVDSDENKHYLREDNVELDKLIETMQNALVDKQFDAWLTKYAVPSTRYVRKK